MSIDLDPFAVLGLSATASQQELRKRYLALVRRYPPERAPEQFERIRDAFQRAQDPRARAEARVTGPEPLRGLDDLDIALRALPRPAAGVAQWRAVLAEARR